MEKTLASNILRQNKDYIFNQWEMRARKEVPAAKSQNKLALIDSLPEFFNTLIELLASEDPAGLHQQKPIAKEHGDQRADIPEYSLDQLISEYFVFRDVLFELLNKREDISIKERDLIWDTILIAIKNSSLKFIKKREGRKEQDHKDLQISHSNLETEQVMRDQFIAILSHDLRNPLSAAKSAAQMIVRYHHDDEKVVKYAHKIDENINRIDKMINDLLDVNQIKAGKKLPLNKSECDIVKIANEVSQELTSVYGTRIKLSAPQSLIGLWDNEAVRRIIENLCSNAIKYGCDESPITLSIEDLQSKVSLSIHNFGKVISIDDQKVLFQPFQQVDSVEGSKIKGWGLGLTLVRGIVEAHGGTVKVESYPEKGTTFTVELPKNKQ